MTAHSSYEFSRPVPLADLEAAPLVLTLEASEAECEALARRFGLIRILSLSATARIWAVSGGAAEAELSLTAEVTQESVISLEPVQTTVTEAWQVRYVPRAMTPDAADEAGAVDVDPDAEDIEVVEGEDIDIGETIAQQLSLALDPYPRGREERLEDFWQNDAETDEESGAHPFEKLRALRQNT